MTRFTPDRLLGATAWRFAYLLAQGGLTLLLFVMLAHALPPDAFAAAAIAQGVLVIAQAVGDFGLSNAAVTALPAEIARRPAEAANLERGAARAFFFAGMAAMCLNLTLVLVVPASARLPVLLIAPASAMAVIVAGADGLIRAAGDFRTPVVLVLANRIGGFAAVPAALLSDSAAWSCAALAGGTVIATVPAVRVLTERYSEGREAPVRELLRASLPLGSAQGFILLGSRFNTLFLAAVASAGAAAAFESAWRVHQLGAYLAGGLATAAAPFLADALASQRNQELRRLLWRMGAGVTVLGILVGASLWAVRQPISTALFPNSGDQVAAMLPYFALVMPLVFLGFLAMVAIAGSPDDRFFILAGYAAGAAVSVTVLLALDPAADPSVAALATAAGLAVAQLIMIARLCWLIARLRGGQRPPYTAPRIGRPAGPS